MWRKTWFKKCFFTNLVSGTMKQFTTGGQSKGNEGNKKSETIEPSNA